MTATDDPSSDCDEFGWEDYEGLVGEVVAALGAASGVEIECSGRSCFVEGPPGSRHQVDVLFSLTDGMHRYRTAVSCRWRSEKVDVAHVREWALIVQEARLSKGVIFSRSGFTGDAVQLAESVNVALVELRNPTDEDWGDSITRVRGEVIIDGGLSIWDVHIVGAGSKDSPDGRSSKDRLLMPDLLVFEMPGQSAMALTEVAEQAHLRNPTQEQHVEDFPDGTVMRTPSDPGHHLDGQAVARISFKARARPPRRLEIDVNAEERIWMIMRNLSESRDYTVTTDGEIIEAH